jgi:RNA polymerase sigma-70 factor (ECF subfamily)
MTEAWSQCARVGVSEIHLTGGRGAAAGRRRAVASTAQQYREVEQEWIERARSGDLRAFDQLVRRYQTSIYALVRRMIREDAVAEELTQDVFLKAYQGLARFREEAAFSTWLYRIAVNHVRDYVASRKARDHKQEMSLEDLELSGFKPVSTTPGPEDATSLSEMATLFDSALARLEPHLLEAFLLRHQEGLGYEQIALVLEISVANAKVRVHRARERILEGLRSLGYEV